MTMTTEEITAINRLAAAIEGSEKTYPLSSAVYDIALAIHNKHSNDSFESIDGNVANGLFAIANALADVAQAIKDHGR
jgi:hypothetical protein